VLVAGTPATTPAAATIAGKSPRSQRGALLAVARKGKSTNDASELFPSRRTAFDAGAAMATLHDAGGANVIYQGRSERLLPACADILTPTAALAAHARARGARRMAADGLRVPALARGARRRPGRGARYAGLLRRPGR
jgi:hypothetical protein